MVPELYKVRVLHSLYKTLTDKAFDIAKPLETSLMSVQSYIFSYVLNEHSSIALIERTLEAARGLGFLSSYSVIEEEKTYAVYYQSPDKSTHFIPIQKSTDTPDFPDYGGDETLVDMLSADLPVVDMLYPASTFDFFEIDFNDLLDAIEKYDFESIQDMHTPQDGSMYVPNIVWIADDGLYLWDPLSSQ